MPPLHPTRRRTSPPSYGGPPDRAPIPDYERERSRPNSRERGWNILVTPGTYLLLGINCAVYLLDGPARRLPQRPHRPRS